MRLSCPFCGPRDSAEFTILGDAGVTRPDPDAPDAPAAFFEAVYLRDNPAGPHREYWYHGAGCRQWLVVGRDTVTHEIFDVTLARRP
ncbi:sarcosine oxidase subunit delta [Zavarzinia compransoris]|uniref:sarcosine oxidase subunit delta n=1 Tax=Zavarzinia marina TaxID=2911065 RepID=UPI001F1DFE22|nr:sarcosine oxidase subunit delta [Zavarzinia marina]MCF4167624.1 sarcosine oxidase subunit delta [Zavarzinia marina]